MTLAMLQQGYDIIEDTDLPDVDRRAIEDGIDTHSDQDVGVRRKPYFIAIRDQGVLIGGMRGESLNGGFYIKHLWVEAACRGTGLGMQMMTRAEQEAARRGCCAVWVDTLSCQAPEFYKKAGYREAGRITGYRGVHDRIFLKKEITGDGKSSG